MKGLKQCTDDVNFSVIQFLIISRPRDSILLRIKKTSGEQSPSPENVEIIELQKRARGAIPKNWPGTS